MSATGIPGKVAALPPGGRRAHTVRLIQAAQAPRRNTKVRAKSRSTLVKCEGRRVAALDVSLGLSQGHTLVYIITNNNEQFV